MTLAQSRSHWLFSNRNVARRRRLARTIGAQQLATKAAARAACAQAVAALAPTKCPDGAPLDTRTLQSVNLDRAKQIMTALR